MSDKVQRHETLEDEYVDMLIREVYRRRREAAIQRSEETLSDSDVAMGDEAYQTALEKWDRLQTAEHCNRRKEKKRNILPKIAHAAAYVLLIVLLVAPIAIANVDALREKVMELLVCVEADHTVISAVENNRETLNVHPDWEGAYYPAYIPEGFESRVEMLDHPMVVFNDGCDYVSFCEISVDFQTFFDSEDGIYAVENMNGVDMYIVEKEKEINVVWSEDGVLLSVRTSLSQEKALQIALSTCKIK